MEDLENSTIKSPTYPPYSIYKETENIYFIDIAVSGFGKDDITIENKGGELLVTGVYKKPEIEKKYLHRGISTRNFCHSFKLAENTLVKGASLNDGILSIKLENIIPEEKLPKKIPIM